jgi:hypothetical protein
MESEIQRLRILRCRRIGREFWFAVYTPKKWKRMPRWLKSPVKDIDLRYIPLSVYDCILIGAEKVKENRLKYVFDLFDKIKLLDHPFLAGLINGNESSVAMRYLIDRKKKISAMKLIHDVHVSWALKVYKGGTYYNLKYINFMNYCPGSLMYYDVEENLCQVLGTGNMRLFGCIFALNKKIPIQVENVKNILIARYDEVDDVEEKRDIDYLRRKYFNRI